MENIKTKICHECNLPLPLTSFYSYSKSKDGRTSKCKKCIIRKTINKNNQDKCVTNEQREAYNKF